MSTPETNPYASPQKRSTDNAPNSKDDLTLFRMAFVAAIWFVIQFAVYSSFDLLIGSIVDVGTLRLTAVIAAWGTVGVFAHGRLESILIPMLALTGLMAVALMQGNASIDLLKAIGAVGTSRLGNRLLTNHNENWIRANTIRSEKHTIVRFFRNSLVSSAIGGILGVSVSCLFFLLFGAWLTLTEALSMFAAIGMFGACGRNLFLTSAWLLLFCGFRFGLSFDTGVYAIAAWCAMLAGRGGAMILNSDDQRKLPT